jgi:hypothetical protein
VFPEESRNEEGEEQRKTYCLLIFYFVAIYINISHDYKNGISSTMLRKQQNTRNHL